MQVSETFVWQQQQGKRTAQTHPLSQQLTIDRKQTYASARREREETTKVAVLLPDTSDDVLDMWKTLKTAVVHKRECPVAMRLKSSFGPRLVSTQWEASESLSFPAKIEMEGIDRIGFSRNLQMISTE